MISVEIVSIINAGKLTKHFSYSSGSLSSMYLLILEFTILNYLEKISRDINDWSKILIIFLTTIGPVKLSKDNNESLV
jgi:hypothetical protein